MKMIYFVIISALVFMYLISDDIRPKDGIIVETPAFPVLPEIREINITTEPVEVIEPEPDPEPVDQLLKMIIEEDVGNCQHNSSVCYYFCFG